jgi:hypothetical protein
LEVIRSVPFFQGNTENDDGGIGTTRSSGKNGIVGNNDSTDAVPTNLPGGNGVYGYTKNPNSSGVHGINDGGGMGMFGFSSRGDGVLGITRSSGKNGIVGNNDSTDAVPPNVPGGNGVFGFSRNPVASGVYGHNGNTGPGIAGFSQNGPGVLGRGALAGRFEGVVEVTGDIRLLGGDFAEEFDMSGVDKVEPGTVMVLSNSEGTLEPSSRAYDKRVAGVASGAGGFKPGIVFDKKQLQESNKNKRRIPIALMGKVYCKVDADYSPIEVGDLLTTSPTVGHAMKADDPIKAFGTVIGKALSSLESGLGTIPILIALQ